MKNKLVVTCFSLLALNAKAMEYPIKSTVLDNGLKVIVCEKNTNQMAQVEVWYRVGSKDEWDGVRGMAHMFEHMMFRGSKNFNGEGDIYIKLIEKMGGNVNAYTTFDRTVYHEEVRSQHVEKVFEMEADRMANLILDQKILDTERQVVGEELRLGENNWYQRMSAERYKHLYPKNHPYQVDVIGFLPEITAFTTKNCQDFFDKYYSPNNAFIVVTGNVKAEDVFAYAKKYFGVIKKQLPPNAKKQEPDVFTNNIELEEMNIDFPVQIYSYIVPAPAFGHKDYYAFNLFSELMFSNPNSILNTNLVMNGNLAYQVASNSDDSRLYNNYANYDVVMQAAMGNAKVKKIISKEINDVITEGMDQELIDNYIKSLEAQSTFGKYSNANIAFELGFAEYYYKDYNEYDAKLAAYKKIKGDDLKIIAQTYFNPEKLKVINIKPIME
ncbi:MAG TPA: pitrilysin family protein [Bacteroidia bacterium]|jgi:zinc protease|nr:pitrilysin family protein [Bacteroidia bacterium]